MKICIIGAGTSAIITALQLLKRNYNFDITIYHDSSTPHLHVGESTTQHVPNLVYDVLGISIHNLFDLGISSYKRGVRFFDWGKGSDFIHNINANEFAIHFDTIKFNEFIHNILKENNLVKYVDEKIISYPENYDFIIDCSGWVDNEEDYDDPFFETVNSAITFKKSLETQNPFCTLHKATEDGWMFGLPFIRENEIRCGYLYNSKFSNPSLDGKKISWKPKLSKKLIQNDRLAYNGNKLFFLEPLQALSLFYYIASANLICDFIEGKKSLISVNMDYSTEMWTYQLSLAFHYHYGSVHDSPFWKDIKIRANEIMKGQWMSGERIERNINHDRMTGDQQSKIGIFTWKDIQQINGGMNIT